MKVTINETQKKKLTFSDLANGAFFKFKDKFRIQDICMRVGNNWVVIVNVTCHPPGFISKAIRHNQYYEHEVIVLEPKEFIFEEKQ